MADGTKIEWADATVNYVNGCSRVSPGCGGPGPFGGCYAERLAGTRLRNHPSREGLAKQTSAGPRWTGEVRENPAALEQVLRWKKPRAIFWNAHGDLFHENVPDEWIDKQFAVMALTPQHRHMVLTKRSARMREYMTDAEMPCRVATVLLHHAGDWGVRGEAVLEPLGERIEEHEAEFVWMPLPNVWLGVSVEDQRRADERIPDLLETPAAIRFISAEPLLGPVDLEHIEYYPGFLKNALTGKEQGGHCPDGPGLDWVIVGGESGPNARPMRPDWARSLRDQCAAAGVPFHFKQWGDCLPPGQMTGDGRIWGGNKPLRAVKRMTGRLLDGVQHDGVPA
ncbi:phage Gp37/Gp68 family protein [Croceicoccus gelatinilyticus]|uniref:phage Gp37/Gp68 family protein n=1 Tax=Croceicoccus gelatinilyticus TaxID=2835536 RepID=UPI001BCE8C5C|nr:phage Gp37/Gp68 family protein [Croceicoccus gelatinilyticus]MBS7669353.1 phage Gp37/Gp68 family protein [Croceicoccus gelatinilyticus]